MLFLVATLSGVSVCVYHSYRTYAMLQRSPDRGPTTFGRAWGASPRRIAFSQMKCARGLSMATCKHVVRVCVCLCQVIACFFPSRWRVLDFISSFDSLYHPRSNLYYPFLCPGSLSLCRCICMLLCPWSLLRRLLCCLRCPVSAGLFSNP